MSDPSDLIARAEAALTGVYDGPWRVIGFGNIASADATKPSVAKAWNTANSEFIAAARALIPEFVAALKAAQAENARLRDQTTWGFGGMYSGGSDV